MKMIKDRKGFSLVEVIIVIAVMGVLTGSTVGIMGYLNLGKTKKASATLNSQLSYIQTQTMTKEGRYYLYLFQTDDGIFYTISNRNASGAVDTAGFVSASELDAHVQSEGSSKLCDSQVTVTASTAAGSTVTLVNLTDSAGANETNMIKIGYDKATGAFTHSCGYQGATQLTDFYNTVKLDGKQTFSVKLVKGTGKHYVVK